MRVAIIGAGISGLYLAWKLAEKGHEVTVFEKKERVGKEICSGLFSERILEFIPEAQKLIQAQINSVLIHWPKRTLQIKFSKKFFVMSHFELDYLVEELARKSGVEIILNFNCARFHLAQFQKEFDKVIGCDGANSIVRKGLGLKDPQFRLAIQGFMNLPIIEFAQIRSQICSNSRIIETWPTKSGFIWKIPREKEIEYGIIDKPKEAKLLLEEFLKKNNLKNNLKLERIKSALISQGLIIPSFPKITLCGEATGLTKPWSGGGVIWGLMAADLLLKNFPDFLKYKKDVQKFFLPKIIFSKLVTKSIYFLGFKLPWLLPKNWQIENDFLI